MADSPTTRKRLRKQTLGSNVNTWGDTNLDEVLDALDQIIDGTETIALTGDVTLTTTNYSTADQAKYRVIKFTGAVASAVTFPSVQGWYLIINATTATVTCKLAASTGVAIPASRTVLIWSDGVDFFSGVPNYLPTAITLTNNQDLVSYTQLSTAIAASVPLGTAGTFFNSAADTTRDYLNAKLRAFGTMVRSTTNAGANETSDLLPVIYTATGTDTYAITPSPAYTAYAAGMAFYVLFTNGNTGAATLNANALGAKSITKNGTTALVTGDIPAASVKLVVYDGTQFQVSPIPSPTLSLTNGGTQAVGFTAAINTKYVAAFGASGTVTMPAAATAGDIIEIAYAGNYVYTHAPNGLKINTSTNNFPLLGNQTVVWEYTGATDGWV